MLGGISIGLNGGLPAEGFVTFAFDETLLAACAVGLSIAVLVVYARRLHGWFHRTSESRTAIALEADPLS